MNITESAIISIINPTRLDNIIDIIIEKSKYIYPLIGLLIKNNENKAIHVASKFKPPGKY